jgi:hypothetical protein
MVMDAHADASPDSCDSVPAHSRPAVLMMKGDQKDRD